MLVHCNFKSEYYDLREKKEKHHNCELYVYSDGLCKFHHPNYLTDQTKNDMAELFYEKLQKAEAENETLLCMGFKLPALTFKGQIKIPINFSKAEFRGKVSGDATFTEEINFFGATFTEEINFFGATFAKMVNFSTTIFTKDAYFHKTTFVDEADFSGATFTEAHFSGATFTKEVNFSGATFTEASFSTTFTKAIFSGATFTKAFFIGSTFTKDASFSGATFIENAYFSGTTFTNADFSGATFTKDVYFSGATFTEAHFFGSIFAKAIFSEATFTKDASFSGATFTKDAYFSGTTFTKADFSGATFIEKAEFVDTKFNDHAYFRKTIFSSPEEINFDCKLHNASFLETKIEKVRFGSKVKWEIKNQTEENEKEGFKIYDERILEKKLYDKKTGKNNANKKEHDQHTDELNDYSLESILTVYRKLRDNYDLNLKYEDAGKFFIRESEMKRIYQYDGMFKKKNIVVRNLSLAGLYNVIARYGESYSRPLYVTGGALIFGMFYFASYYFTDFSKIQICNVKECDLGDGIIRAINAMMPFGKVIDQPSWFDWVLKFVFLPLGSTSFIAIKRKFERRLRH